MKLTKKQQAEIALLENQAIFYAKGRNCADKSMGRARRSKAKNLLRELRRLKSKPSKKGTRCQPKPPLSKIPPPNHETEIPPPPHE
jgi:hypothetical protein